MKRSCMLLLVALVTPAAPAHAHLMINVNPDSSFNTLQGAVIFRAKTDWLSLLTFNGPGDHTIRINITTDNSLTQLATTTNWETDPDGRVISVDVAIKTAAHNWTQGPPAEDMHDALNTLRHEFAHAIGFSTNLPLFNANVLTIGGNRFYDLMRNGMYDAGGDFDLIDDANMGTHAPANSGDLMQPDTPMGTRLAPTMQHAAVLAHAYGYRVIPAPPTAALIVFASLLVRGRRRRG
jgi:hypothetical protein